MQRRKERERERSGAGGHLEVGSVDHRYAEGVIGQQQLQSAEPGVVAVKVWLIQVKSYVRCKSSMSFK